MCGPVWREPLRVIDYTVFIVNMVAVAHGQVVKDTEGEGGGKEGNDKLNNCCLFVVTKKFPTSQC